MAGGCWCGRWILFCMWPTSDGIELTSDSLRLSRHFRQFDPQPIEMCKGRKMATIECLTHTKDPWNWTRSFARWYLQLLHVHDTSLQFGFYSLARSLSFFFFYITQNFSFLFRFCLLFYSNTRRTIDHRKWCAKLEIITVWNGSSKRSSQLIVFFTCIASGVNGTSLLNTEWTQRRRIRFHFYYEFNSLPKTNSNLMHR